MIHEFLTLSAGSVMLLFVVVVELLRFLFGSMKCV